MKKDIWIYKKGKYVRATYGDLFWRKINHYKIINTEKYKLIPYDDFKYYFKLSPKEYETIEKYIRKKELYHMNFINVLE